MAQQARSFSPSDVTRLRSRPSGRELALLALILLIGILLRVAYLGELRRAPDLEHPPVDGGFTLYWARALATGDWSLPPEAGGRNPRIRSYSYIRPPGYAFVLAGLYRLGQGSQVVMRGAQMAVGLVSVVLAWLLGRALLGPAVALVWAGSMVACWSLLYFEGGINETWIVVFLALLLIRQLRCSVLRPAAHRAAVAGGLLGLTALFRPTVLLFAPVALGWAWWALRRHGSRRFVLLASVGALGASAVLAPALIRNLRVEGALVPVSADGGLVLYRGNNDDAVGFSTSQMAELGLIDSPWAIPDVVARMEARLHRRLTFVQASREMGREAVSWIANHPRQTVRLVARRAALFWGPDEIAHNRAVGADRMSSPLLRTMPVGFSVALGGTLVGIAVLFSERRRPGRVGSLLRRPGTLETLLLVGLFVGAWSLSFLPFLVTSLYRAPVIPFLLLGLAVALVHLGELIRARRPAAATTWAGALLLGLFLAHIPIVSVPIGLERWHYDRGVASFHRGDRQAAEDSFRAALAEDPALWSAHNALGKLAYDAGDLARAEVHFRRAVSLQGDDPVARFNLGLVEARAGRWAEAAASFAAAVEWAPTNAEAWVHLGICRERQGRLADARAAYEGALAQRPDHRRSANNLAWLLATAPAAELRDGQRAVALAESVVARGADPSAVDTLAVAYAEAGRFEEAVAAAERALALIGNRDTDFARQVETRRGLYRAGRPYRQP